MKIDKQHITSNKRPRTKITPKKITIHSTGNERSTSQNERDWLMNPSNNRNASWHYVVGDNTIIEAIPPNEMAWHSGIYEGNRTSIGIEMVHTGNREKVIENTIELTRYLQGKFNISNDNVVRHYDWTKKNCPSILNYNNWQGWKDFKKKLGSNPVEGRPVEKELYRVRKNWKDVDSQKGAYSDLNNAIAAVKKLGKDYKIFNSKGEQIYPKTINDIKGHWAEKDIVKLLETGILTGFPDGTFRPNDPLTRGQFASILMKLDDMGK